MIIIAAHPQHQHLSPSLWPHVEQTIHKPLSRSTHKHTHTNIIHGGDVPVFVGCSGWYLGKSYAVCSMLTKFGENVLLVYGMVTRYVWLMYVSSKLLYFFCLFSRSKILEPYQIYFAHPGATLQVDCVCRRVVTWVDAGVTRDHPMIFLIKVTVTTDRQGCTTRLLSTSSDYLSLLTALLTRQIAFVKSVSGQQCKGPDRWVVVWSFL